MLRRPRSRLPSATSRRALVHGIVVTGIALSVAGCNLVTAPVAPRPSRLVATPEPRPSAAPVESDEVPTLRPEPSGAANLVDAANALADLDSYRVAVTSRGLVPASTPNGRVTMTSTLVQGADPAAEFTMTGVDGFEGGRLQAIVIGEEAWLKSGTAGWLKSPGGAADFDAAFTALSPIDLVSGFEGLATNALRVGEERRNGQRAIRYRSDEDQAAAVGLAGGTADLWLAVDGGYLVSLAIEGTWDLDGTPTPITLAIDVTNVNDPANRVDPPP